ncbi:interleukin-6 receptor subunit beta-like isoform X2 [Chiloscyllium plagiosum]|uniref:interleukin-6 receptor subunit beta-like isoform X2 n=1 Tax=Chiloscyllium plagiosum TaxID=36176 RepID=UPI001CB821F8|nr:interleukin-6 receptor subunit beta-like isoform X2 [Chiloscyllium plagiosum]XP_043573917.1 interleukin-6 receptor subunit beta-like isoform X2 [Chiloscyllium plagiosum]
MEARPGGESLNTMWKSVDLRSLLCCLVYLLGPHIGVLLDAHECLRITVSANPVHWGSSLVATCKIINTSCIMGSITHASQIMWQLDNMYIVKTQYTVMDRTMSQVNISAFKQTVGNLTCEIPQRAGGILQNGVRIQAGFPPMKPTNLTCVTSWKEKISMTCSWDPGRDPYIRTTYTLRRIKNLGKCHNHGMDAEWSDCFSQDSHSCTVPRDKLRLFSTDDIFVLAENELGSQVSDVLCLDAMDVVKLEQPVYPIVQADQQNSHCLIISWTMNIKLQIKCQLQYREYGESAWRQMVAVINQLQKEERLCQLSPGTEYLIRLRCMLYDTTRYWSDWSAEYSGCTAESSPVGIPEVWWHFEGPVQGENMYIRMFWKELKKSEMNGKIRGYRVTFGCEPDTNHPEVTLCNTTSLSCRISTPKGDGNICVRAYNAAGHSPAALLALPTLHQTGIAALRPFVNIIPITEHSLQIYWTHPSIPVLGYIVEWCKMSEEYSCEINWKKVSADSTGSILQENIEPMKRYAISIYPLLLKGLALPYSTEAYSKQGAPLTGPKVSANRIWKSKAEVIWEEIPTSKRQGFIRNYTIFYSDKTGPVQYIVRSDLERRYTLTGLLAATNYEVKVMATTDAGGTNGSVLNFTTKKSDDGNILIIIAWLFPILLLLMSILLLTYFLLRKMLTGQLWPKIPNPANSTLANWTPGRKAQDWNCLEGVPDHVVSSVTLLQRDARQNTAFGAKSKPLLDDENALSIDLNIKSTNGVETPHCCSEGRNYVVYMPYHNLPEEAQYATVMHSKDQIGPPTLFLRSNSTQPLLHELTSSPKPYENPWFTMSDTNHSELSQDFSLSDIMVEEDEIRKTFPLLWGLVSEHKAD